MAKRKRRRTIRCPDCIETDTGRCGRCDDCRGRGHVGGQQCANCQGTGSPICCRCEGTRRTEYDPALDGTVTRVEKCLKCGKLVRSDRMEAHIQTHLDKTRAPVESGVQRIERLFSELEHYGQHKDPDCPTCQKVAKDMVVLRPVRYRICTVTSGDITVHGRRMPPEDRNVWHYAVVRNSRDGATTLIGEYATDGSVGSIPQEFWWHNEGPGYDEGGNNRAAFLIGYLIGAGVIRRDEIEGTRDAPVIHSTYRSEIEEP